MRKYAHIQTAIWRDKDFVRLSPGAQRLYFLLLSRPEISAAGTLDLTVRRWAALSAGTTEDDVRAALDELHDARFVVVDQVTEEVLVRSFVRWDGGAGNSKRRPVIIDAAHAVDSYAIAYAIRQEFERLDLPANGLPDTPPDALPDGAPDGTTRFDRVVV